MGLIPPGNVPTFFYVESPNSTHIRSDAPQISVSFTGTRRDVLIDDVIAVNGLRSPGPNDTSKIHRQAFIYIVSNGHTLDNGADREARQDPHRLGGVLPAGDGEPHDGEYQAAIGRTYTVRPTSVTCRPGPTSMTCRPGLSGPHQDQPRAASASRAWRS